MGLYTAFLRSFAFLFCSCLFFSSCAPPPNGVLNPKVNYDQANPSTPGSTEGYEIEVKPLWESTSSKGREWTIFTMDMVKQYGTYLMYGPADVETFCPNYYDLTKMQKLNFWAYFISAVTKYESNFDPTTRYKEVTMGIDPVTGQQVYSEGLLQLSYQDVKAYPYCNEFDWNTDKKLKPTDPKKTIFDPFKNLRCGIRILEQQVHQVGKIAINEGAYWYVLEPQFQPMHDIVALTSKISLCR